MGEKIGQVFQIPLSDGKFAYCQMVSGAKHAFFDFFENGENLDLEKITSSSVLFYITVDSYVFKEGIWKLLGTCNVKRDFIRTEPFSYDSLKKTYVIWRVVDGVLKQIPATSEEIKDLECFAAWNDRHVIQRLEDYLAGRPNYYVESQKNRHDPNFPFMTEFYKRYGYDYKSDK